MRRRGDRVTDSMRCRAWTVLAAVTLAVGISACTGTSPDKLTPDVDGGAADPCASAVSHGDVAYEQLTTVGAVRKWTGYGGLATVAPAAIRHYSPAHPTSATAAWCWVSTSDGYDVYLVGPSQTARLIGTLGGSVPSPGGTPVWD